MPPKTSRKTSTRKTTRKQENRKPRANFRRDTRKVKQVFFANDVGKFLITPLLTAIEQQQPGRPIWRRNGWRRTYTYYRLKKVLTSRLMFHIVGRYRNIIFESRPDLLAIEDWSTVRRRGWRLMEAWWVLNRTNVLRLYRQLPAATLAELLYVADQINEVEAEANNNNDFAPAEEEVGPV